MSDKRSTKVLFREWRKGDAEAGQLMAQRFADWYYAVATSRLGEEDGQAPCQQACARFGEGVVQISDARQLITWAYDIIIDEIRATGKARITDGDDPNAYTGNQSPKQLLAAAREALPSEMTLLEAVYGPGQDTARIEQLAEPLGGNPLGILKARYLVKRWLQDHKRIPFEVAPEEPILDRAPLPLYESAKMASEQEEVNFEQWMLSDLDLCKDIAEFAHFAIALRGGIPDVVAPQPNRQAASSVTDASSTTASAEPEEEPKAGLPLVAGVAIVFVLLLLVLGALGIAGIAYVTLFPIAESQSLHFPG